MIRGLCPGPTTRSPDQRQSSSSYSLILTLFVPAFSSFLTSPPFSYPFLFFLSFPTFFFYHLIFLSHHFFPFISFLVQNFFFSFFLSHFLVFSFSLPLNSSFPQGIVELSLFNYLSSFPKSLNFSFSLIAPFLLYFVSFHFLIYFVLTSTSFLLFLLQPSLPPFSLI